MLLLLRIPCRIVIFLVANFSTIWRPSTTTMGVNIGLGDAQNPDRGYQLYLTALVMVLVAGMVVLGRLAARWAKKGYGYDDYAIIVSLVRSLDRAY